MGLSLIPGIFSQGITNYYGKSAEVMTSKIDGHLASGLTRHENLVYSPSSIFNMLMAVYIGTEEGSESMRELNRFLNVSSTVKTDAIEYKNEINKKLGERLQQYILYSADLNENFIQTTKHWNYEIQQKPTLVGIEPEINKKVAENTNNMITELFKKNSFLPNTNLVLFNTIFFQTRNKSFLARDVPFMFYKSAKPMRIMYKRDYTFIQIPFKTDKNSSKHYMSIVTGPKRFSQDREPDYDFSGVQLADVKAAFPEKMRERKVRFGMPKFEFQSKLKVKKMLKALGLTQIFGHNGEPRLTNMYAEYKNEYVQKMVHKAAIKVDEKGAKASATSGMSFAFKSLPPSFYLTEPFKFFIHDSEYSNVMFQGNVYCPAEGAKKLSDCQ